MIHFERRLGAGWSTDQKPVVFLAFHLTLHPFRVQMRVSASAMLIPGHYLKRPKPISYPYGDVLLAKYRGLPAGCCPQIKVGLLLIRTISHYDSAECRVGFI
jgi:hypothetical protein